MDDTEYGLGASVFTRDRGRARADPAPARRRQRLLEHRRPLDACACRGPGGATPASASRCRSRASAASCARRPGTSPVPDAPAAAEFAPGRAVVAHRVVEDLRGRRRSASSPGAACRRPATPAGRRRSGHRSARTRSTPRASRRRWPGARAPSPVNIARAASRLSNTNGISSACVASQDAAEHRRLPREQVHPHRAVRELRLGEPDRRDAEHARRCAMSVHSSRRRRRRVGARYVATRNSRRSPYHGRDASRDARVVDVWQRPGP